MTYEFEVEEGGRVYQCRAHVAEQTQSGARVLSQRIEVIGVGEKNDPREYGSTDSDAYRKGIARVIAGEILRECLAPGR